MQNKIFLLFSLLLLISCAGAPVPDRPGNDARLLQYQDPERLLELVEQPEPDIRIIDVRSVEAYAKGHIPGAENYPETEIKTRLDELSKENYLIFYCVTGERVENLFKELRALGYTRILNFGGIMFWPYERETMITENQ